MNTLGLYLQRTVDLIFPPRESELLVRHAAQVVLQPELRAAAEHTALLSYKEPLINALIVEAKFHHNKSAQQLLGSALRTVSLPQNIIFVPIPLSRRRQRERGYNQVTEILKASGLPYIELLQRTRHTIPQMDLPRKDRLKNLHGAFCIDLIVAQNIDKDTPLVLLDDVTTTGTTLDTGAAALRNAAFSDVRTLALAH